jgi:hypothetical protein
MPHSGSRQKSSCDGDPAGENTMFRFCRSLAWIAATFAALAFGVAAVAAQTGYPGHL